MATKPVNVLVVDDDEIDVMAVQRAFRKLKITNPLFSASDGLKALDMLRGRGAETVPKPYVILLDLNMPRMNGVEFLSALRDCPEHHDAAVFVLTTSNDDRDKAEAWNKNVAGYIVKGREGEDFLEVVTMVDRYWRVVELPS